MECNSAAGERLQGQCEAECEQYEQNRQRVMFESFQDSLMAPQRIVDRSRRLTQKDNCRTVCSRIESHDGECNTVDEEPGYIARRLRRTDIPLCRFAALLPDRAGLRCRLSWYLNQARKKIPKEVRSAVTHLDHSRWSALHRTEQCVRSRVLLRSSKCGLTKHAEPSTISISRKSRS